MARFITPLVLLIVLAACGGAGLPSTSPGITGTITRLAAGSILVEERPEEQSGSDKASIRLTDATTIWHETANGRERASAADLREGQRVQAWFDGPVAESYPVQAKAAAVLILAP